MNSPIMSFLSVEEDWDPEKVWAVPVDEQMMLRAADEYGARLEFIDDAFVYIDDTVQVQVNDGNKLIRSAANTVRVHYEALGRPGEDGPEGPLGLKKWKGWASTGTMLGVDIDLNRMLVSLPSKKVEKMERLLYEIFPQERETATVKEIQSLIGTLRSYAFCIRPGRYFLRRLIDVLLTGGEAGYQNNPNRLILSGWRV
jgi:hypothetical protein